MDYIVFCFVHWKVENISKVNWWEHIIGCMQLRQREPYFIASYHNISNDLKRLNLYYEVHSLYGDVLCQFMLTVHSLPVRFMLWFATCDSQLAKSPKKSFCYGNHQNCIFIEKKKPKRKKTPFVFLIIVFIHFICFY